MDDAHQGSDTTALCHAALHLHPLPRGQHGWRPRHAAPLVRTRLCQLASLQVCAARRVCIPLPGESSSSLLCQHLKAQPTQLRMRAKLASLSLFVACIPCWHPLMRQAACRYDRPELTGSYTLNDQFMLGPSILVAPVLTEGAASRDVFLPPGVRWYAQVLLKLTGFPIAICMCMAACVSACSNTRSEQLGRGPATCPAGQASPCIPGCSCMQLGACVASTRACSASQLFVAAHMSRGFPAVP